MTYTTGEKWRIGWLTLRGARQIYRGGSEDAVDPRVEQEMDRITDRAAQRRERNAQAALRQLEKAEDDLADAEVAFRAARGPEKAAARRARNDAKARVRRADAAARRYR